MAKEDGYIDVGGFVVESGEKLKEKAKKLFKQDNAEMTMPFVNKVLNEIMGEPTIKEKKIIQDKINNKGANNTIAK